MRLIPLTKGLFAQVDDEDYEKLNNHKWQAKNDRNNFYAHRNLPRDNGIRRKEKMHNVIMGEKYIDHIDGNGLNNQKSNLRKCSVSENNRNRRLSKTKTKGVHFRRGRWNAQIQIDKKHLYLGSFSCLLDAQLAYDKAAIEYHGEFARLNFPERKI